MSSDWASSAGEDGPEDKNMSRSKKTEELLHRHPMAVHLRMPTRRGLFGRSRWTAFTLLCFTAYGHPGMEPIWAAFRLEEEGDESIWKEAVDILTGQMNNLVVVCIWAPHWRYHLRCGFPSMAILDGEHIIVPLTISLQVCYRNRACVYGTTMAIAGPTISIANAAILLAFGMLSAVWWAEDRGMKVFTAAFLLIPVSTAFYCVVVFITAGPPLLRLRRGAADVFYTPVFSQIRPASTELQPLSVPSGSPTPDTDLPP
ncbi:hypothetical protein C8J57DRAFT_1593166 [Mycena rebaudengoi]|nr:hypothetical protein C8J57DRAFT_1593166 [Mycena rebaudengoi]